MMKINDTVSGRTCVGLAIALLLALNGFFFPVAAEIPKRESVWEIEVGSQSDTCVAIADDGTIYFGTPEGELVAVTSEGEVKWKYRVGDEVRSSPAIGDDGTIYFGSRDRHVYAVSSEGQRLWRHKTGGWVDSSPAIASNGNVIVGSWDKNLYCLDAEGTKQWDFKTGAPVTSSPAISLDGTIYFGSHDGNLYALDSDGTLKWAYQTGGQITSSPAINGEDCLYVTSVDGFLYALNLDGSMKWKLKTSGITESSPVIGSDGTVCLGVNKELWSVSPEGAKRWARKFNDFIRITPCIDTAGYAYAISDYGMLRIYDPTGGWAWQFYLHTPRSASPALGTNGMFYTSGKWTNLYALQADAPLARSSWPKFRADPRNTGRVGR